MTRSSATLLKAIILAVACASAALAYSQATFDEIDAIFSPFDTLDEPGLAVLVVDNGKVTFRRGYGVTDLRELHPIDAKTNFRLASFTKQFTAMSIMLLVHDGKLHYDDHLTDIFPEFPAYGKTITIRNLLNHTGGLPDYEDLYMKQFPKTSEEKIPQIHDAEVLKLLEHETSGKFSAGSKWDYSNSGYVVLGLVVEKVSGKSFGEFLRERIFVPLKMKSTLAYVNRKNNVSNRAYGHTKEKDGWRETDQSPTSATLGDGGIYSSIDDLAKWDAALRDHTLLSDAEMQAAVTPVQPSAGPAVAEDGQNVSYGFGWHLEPYKKHARMWHNGETMGFGTTIQRFPADKLTIIVLANRTDVNPEQLALRVADLYLLTGPRKKTKPSALARTVIGMSSSRESDAD